MSTIIEPDYSNYTLEELEEAYTTIDGVKYPNRLQDIQERIDSIKSGSNNVGTKETIMGNQHEVMTKSQLKRWNWGAFFLNWIWGLGNRTYIALLMFVPVVNVIMPFVLGAKGNEWAWNNKNWKNEEHFRSVQRNWSVAGALVFIAILPLLYLLPSIYFKTTEPFKVTFAALQADTRVMETFGVPLNTSILIDVNLNMQFGKGKGYVDLSFPVWGPNGEGQVKAVVQNTEKGWVVDSLVVNEDGVGEKSPSRIVVVERQ